ncbi:hypothetical protein PV04_02918 [Phialophora macrospora]|uniref:Uncharacterized protein n=1 Tax=Phialophora macrospora TaxID=1851006 RepID=A0A0D2FQQ5_9EURO|nr:hypothetical protein PV04_02918 [Phialophora macrospora]
MPRLSPALIRQARAENPLLTLLLQVCRDLPSARNELRWLREHAHDAVNAKRYASQGPPVPHADLGVETPHEMGWPGTVGGEQWQRKAEDSPVPTESTKQGLGIVRKFRAHERTKPLIRTHQTDMAFRIRLQQVDVANDINATTSIQAQDSRADEKSSVINDEMPDYRQSRPRIKYAKAAEKNRQLKKTLEKSSPRSSTIKTWSRNGSGELGLHAHTGKILLSGDSASNSQAQKLLVHNVNRRSKGVPLQYIIGNQPFGTLDILCQRGVLIPRPETEMYTEKVAKLLLSALTATQRSGVSWWQGHDKIRILDLCTGTGCIALLLYSILKPIGPSKPTLPRELDIEIVGVDFNPRAVELARKNLHHNVSQKLLHPDAIHSVSFQQVDVLALGKRLSKGDQSEDQLRRIVNAVAAGVVEEDISPSVSSAPWDMVIANPPYIGPKDYDLGGKTEPSVRNYEPKEALVPVADGFFKSPAIIQADLFYQPLIRIAQAVNAQLLVMEVGDSSQGARVGKMVVKKASTEVSRSSNNPRLSLSWRGDGLRLEAWRDDEAVRVLPTQARSGFEIDFTEDADPEVSDRAIVVWSGRLADWRRRSLPASNRPASATEEAKAKLRQVKDEAAKSRKAMKSTTRKPAGNKDDASPAYPELQFSEREEFLAQISEKRRQEARGVEV